MKDLLTKSSWVLTALASLNIGLKPLGLDVLTTDFVQTNLAALITPLHYLIGLAGLFSLVLFFTSNKND